MPTIKTRINLEFNTSKNQDLLVRYQLTNLASNAEGVYLLMHMVATNSPDPENPITISPDPEYLFIPRPQFKSFVTLVTNLAPGANASASMPGFRKIIESSVTGQEFQHLIFDGCIHDKDGLHLVFIFQGLEKTGAQKRAEIAFYSSPEYFQHPDQITEDFIGALKDEEIEEYKRWKSAPPKPYIGIGPSPTTGQPVFLRSRAISYFLGYDTPETDGPSYIQMPSADLVNTRFTYILPPADLPAFLEALRQLSAA